jgi:glutamine synthetase
MQSVTTAIKEYIDPLNIAFFKRLGVFSEAELVSRYEIKCETYLKKVQIESRVIGDLATNHIIPTAITYQNVLIHNVEGLKRIFPDESEMVQAEVETIRTINKHITAVRALAHDMVEARKKWNAVEDISQRAEGYESEVAPFIAQIRYHIDHLELIVDDRLWTLPKYRELFTI